MKKRLQTIWYVAILSGSMLHADYLENLLNHNNAEAASASVVKSDTVSDTATTPMQEGNITSEKELSLVLLSFEKEAEQKALAAKRAEEAAKKRAAKKKAEEERARAEEAAKQAAAAAKPTGVPSLEEQMRMFKQGRGNIPYMPIGTNGQPVDPNTISSIAVHPKMPIYGVFCKNGRCYALGDHHVYKEGDTVMGRKIMEITSSFIRYKDGEKVWYTR